MSIENKIHTLLSLNRYAKIMGLPPAYFNSAYSTTIFTSTGGTCDHIWWEYDWQKDEYISRYSLSQAIYGAEQDIKALIGFSPAPAWEVEEVQQYPRYYRREYYAGVYNPRGVLKSIQTQWGKVIGGGQRATTLVASPTTVSGITGVDADGDGFEEIWRITASVSTTAAQEIKVYHAGHSADPAWEIRPCITKSISAGTFTADFYVWQFVDPDLYEQFPTDDELSPISLDDSGNLVSSVEVYREYLDTTDKMCELWWEPTECDAILPFSCSCGTSSDSCTSCAHTTQGGCLHIRDSRQGLVVPSPATYNSTTGVWDADTYAVCREPDFVKLWYYAGEISQDYLNGRSFDPLSQFWAEIIAMVATARLTRPLCSCGNINARAEDLATDLARSEPGGERYSLTWSLLDNPLGTRKGEVIAWKKIKDLVGVRTDGVAI